MSEPPLDAVYAALAAGNRRAICGYVADADPHAVALDELARRIESNDRDGDRRPRSSAEREIRTRLHHVGLPKLNDADVIEYDSERREVTAGPALPLAVDLVRAAAGAPEQERL